MSTAWTTALQLWSVELLAGTNSPLTIELRLRQLGWLVDFLGDDSDPWTVTRGQLVAFMAARAETAPAAQTKRSLRAALRIFYDWAVAEGYLPAARNPAARLPAIRCPIGIPRPAADDVVRDTMASCDQRELMAILLGAESGLRRAEITCVHTDNLRPGYMLWIRGKGRRERVVPLTPATWMAIRALPRGWVFPNSRDPREHITAGWLGKVLRKKLPPGTTPHMLRHAAATALVDQGLPITDVAAFLGHASVATTQVYTLVRPERIAAGARAAAGRLHGAERLKGDRSRLHSVA